MAVSLKSKGKPGMECSVCMNEFSHGEVHTPRVLNCGHSLCECCLKELAKHKEDVDRTNRFVVCPTCLTTSNFHRSVDEFPKNFSLMELINSIAEDEENCTMNFCTEHVNYVEELFCHTEEKAICLKCKVYGEHKSHEVTDLAEFADKKRTMFEGCINNLGALVESCSQMKNGLTNQISELQGNYVFYKDMIEAQFVELQERIMEKMQAKLATLLLDFSRMYEKQNNYLKTNKTVLTSKIKQLTEIKETLETFLKSSGDLEIAKDKVLLQQAEQTLGNAREIQLTTEHNFDIRIGEKCICEAVTAALNQWMCRVVEPKSCKKECLQTIHEDIYENLEKSGKVKGNIWKNITFQQSEKHIDTFFGRFH